MLDRIVVAGDWHSDTGWAISVVDTAARAGIETLLHVGDFGIGMGRPDYEACVEAAAAEAGVVLYVVPGNHENHDMIDSVLKADRRDADGFAKLTEHIRIAPRAHTWEWSGRRFASLMGAYSIDQDYRTPGASWWPQEEPTMADYDRLIAITHGYEIDVLVGHDVPQGTPTRSVVAADHRVAGASRHTRELLSAAVRELRPDAVFAGHWHQRLTHRLNRRTRVEVLDKERTPGNAVVLYLDSLGVAPLPLGP